MAVRAALSRESASEAQHGSGARIRSPNMDPSTRALGKAYASGRSSVGVVSLGVTPPASKLSTRRPCAIGKKPAASLGGNGGKGGGWAGGGGGGGGGGDGPEGGGGEGGERPSNNSKATLSAAGTVALVQRSREVINQLKASLLDNSAMASSALQQAGLYSPLLVSSDLSDQFGSMPSVVEENGGSGCKAPSAKTFSPRSSELKAKLGLAMDHVTDEVTELSSRMKGDGSAKRQWSRQGGSKTAEVADCIAAYERTVATEEAAPLPRGAQSVELSTTELRNLLVELRAAKADSARNASLVKELGAEVSLLREGASAFSDDSPEHILENDLAQLVSEANSACKALAHAQQRCAAEKQRADAAEAALTGQLSDGPNSQAKMVKEMEELRAELAAQRQRVGLLEEEKAAHWSPFHENCGASTSSGADHSGVSDDDDTVSPVRPKARGLRRRDSATSLSYGDLASLSEKMQSRENSPNKVERRTTAPRQPEPLQGRESELSALRLDQVTALSELHAEMSGVVSGLERTTAKLMAAEGRILELQQDKHQSGLSAEEVQAELTAASRWLEETSAQLERANAGMASLSIEKESLEARVAAMEAKEANFHRIMEAELQEQLREREAWMEQLEVELAHVRAEQAAQAEGAKGEVQGELGCAVDWLEETAHELAAAQERVSELEAEKESLRAELYCYKSSNAQQQVSMELPTASGAAMDGKRAIRAVYQSAMNALRVELMNKAKLMEELMLQAESAAEKGDSSAAAEEAAAAKAELSTSMAWLEETAGQLATAMSDLEDANQARCQQENWEKRAGRGLEKLSTVKAELEEKNALVEELRGVVDQLRGAKGELEVELEEVQGVSELALACLEETASELEEAKVGKGALEEKLCAKEAEVEKLRQSVASYVSMGAKAAMASEFAEEKQAAEAAATEAELTRQLGAARVALGQLRNREKSMREELAVLEAKHAGVCQEKIAMKARLDEMAVALEQQSLEAWEADVAVETVLEALVVGSEAEIGQARAVAVIDAEKATIEARAMELQALCCAREEELAATERGMAELRADMEVLMAEIERLRANSATKAGPMEVQELSNALVWLERTADQLSDANAKIAALQADKRALQAMIAVDKQNAIS